MTTFDEQSQWRHFFKLRLSKRAHPQMREIAVPLFYRLRDLLPVIFADLEDILFN